MAHPRPLLEHDRTAVAPELSRQAFAVLVGEQLRRLELLDQRERFGLGTCAGLVVSRERKEDDEPEEHGIRSREDPKHAGGAIAIVEVPAVWCPPADEEPGGDRDG